MWLANLELKLQSERLSGQLKMTLYDTAEVSNVSGDASHLMKIISEAKLSLFASSCCFSS